MLAKLISGLAGRDTRSSPPVREKLVSVRMPAVVYAIGDIHGCLNLLKELERRIVEDAAGIQGAKWIVCLGDYVDRGPRSAQVLDHLMAPPPSGFRRICLAGNHEQFAFDFIRNGQYANGWFDVGGRETLASYGLHDISSNPARLAQQLAECIPEAHVAFIGALPAMLAMPGFIFVHAGIDPRLTLEAQRDEVLLWSRPWEFVWPEAGTGCRIVHGHTPVAEPEIGQHRINIDLGAFASGRLCALKVTADRSVSVIVAG
jgi:serine/threonine protein phosphatase 1